MQMSEQFRKAYLLFALEPEFDVQRPYQFRKALNNADIVVAVTSYVNDGLLSDADVLLPLGTFTETAGTFVNCEGVWQSFNGLATPVGESRPGWKILRVLGNLFDIGGFEFNTAEEVRESLKLELGEIELPTRYTGSADLNLSESASHAYLDMPIYAIDPLVRRSMPLQETRAAKEAGNHFFKTAIV
jgi:NADH-quinone oxidoreductase subunit G